MKTKFVLLTGICVVLLIAAGVVFVRKTKSSNGSSVQTHLHDLEERVTSQLPPVLKNLSNLPAKSVTATNRPASGIQSRCLSEEVLLPLRRAFAPPRFTTDPNIPRDRQTLLSNRLLISPEKRSIPKAASGQQTPTARMTTPFIVQFNIPVSETARKLLSDAGALVRGFFPNNAVLAELTPEALNQLNALNSVQAASEFLPSDKVQPFLSSLIASYTPETRLRVTVQTLAPADAEPVAAAIRATGGEVEAVKAGTRWGLVNAFLPLSAVSTLTARGDVQWIEERPLLQQQNDKASIASHLNTANVWNTWGLTGKGQIVGHGDTGLDTGNLSTMHADLRGRILAVIPLARENDASDLNGHGTHTAGSIIGNGTVSGGQIKGMAWEAQLVHQSLGNESDKLTGIPADIYDLFLQTYAYGARVHSDSWGGDSAGEYTANCRSADLFAWDYPDHLAVFSCGNAGRDSDRNGVVETGSVGSPAAAKNVLTVGAAENDRPAGSGGHSSYKLGTLWPSWFPADPIKNDYVSYSATTMPYRQGIAGFSSRGPTDDDRIKPDVVAPGTDILSTRSSVGGALLWGFYASNSQYCFSGGTSMAAPLAAGTALLMRQYAIERVGITNPSAALIKAMLVGGARSLAPGQYGTNSYQEIPFTSPNNVEGWGEPDIANTVFPTNKMIRLYDRIGPAGGATNTFEVTVTESHTSLDVALVWIDYPATAGTGITLVNDLDLIVVAPDGTVFYPNDGTSRDSVNTVETLRLSDAQAGIYTIHVIGAAVPYTGGAAALYVRGTIDAAPVCSHTELPDQMAGAIPYPVDFQIQSMLPLTNNESRLFWTVGNTTAPTGIWQSVTATWLSNTFYRAEIPVQPPQTHIYYYFQIVSSNYTVHLPKTAPEQTFSFYVDFSVELVVNGSPSCFGTVTPPYGTNTEISHVSFKIAAPETVTVSDGVRHTCTGWSGTGDVPSGSSNSATLVICQNSTLSWHWDDECALTTQYRLANTGQIFGQTQTWYSIGTSVSTETADELGFVGSTPYAFCGWYVDGSRWPDAASVSLNPATGILMTGPRTAQGDYLPFWQDTDGNFLSDWWEIRYFGSATNAALSASDDLDGDGWTNLAEFFDNTDPNDAGSVPTPPAVDVKALDVFQKERSPWTVTATVTDNWTVETVNLLWREQGESTWHTNAMTWVTNDTYSAELAPPSHGAKKVAYRVYAADLLGYYAPEYGTLSATYCVVGNYSAPWLQVTPSEFDIFELSETPTNAALTIANWAGPDLTWTVRVAAAAAPFTATNSAWLHHGDNDVWCVTTNRTWNGDAVWYCGNSTSRTYPNSCHAMLDTPSFLVGSGGGLLFRQWMKTEYDQDIHFWDGAVIRISTDGGNTFTIIEPTTGYPYQITENSASPFETDQPCLAGTGTGWETLLLDLSAYAGQSVIIRFEFGSDGYITNEGWYIAGVTPFSYDEPFPEWIRADGPWGGLLPDTYSTSAAITLDPAALDFDSETFACLRVESNDPSSSPLIPLTVRRGHHLTAIANGPGTAAADTSFLFRDTVATVTLRAAEGCYLYSVLINGVPLPGIYDYTTVYKTVTFSHVTENQTLIAWFTPRIWTLTVDTSYSTSSPAAGTYMFTNGTWVTASVIAPIEVYTGIRHQTTGWTLTGHTPDRGTQSAMSFQITNNATLSWHWCYEFLLQVTAEGNGTVAPEHAWCKESSYLSVTSYPAVYYHLASWSGNTNNALFSSNRLSFVISEPRSITASFMPNLTSTRGIPEYWLAAHGWDQDFENAAEADPDHDGMATWAEWMADTDPTNTASLLACTLLRVQENTSTTFVLTWCGGTNRTQLIQHAQAPAGPWITVFTNPPPTSVTNAIAVPAFGNTGFYRIQIK